MHGLSTEHLCPLPFGKHDPQQRDRGIYSPYVPGTRFERSLCYYLYNLKGTISLTLEKF